MADMTKDLLVTHGSHVAPISASGSGMHREVKGYKVYTKPTASPHRTDLGKGVTPLVSKYLVSRISKPIPSFPRVY
jgi:hypothetical protein